MRAVHFVSARIEGDAWGLPLAFGEIRPIARGRVRVRKPTPSYENDDTDTKTDSVAVFPLPSCTLKCTLSPKLRLEIPVRVV
jgi:hypothetical protein